MLFSGQAGVTGTRFTFLPKTTEKFFKKTLDTRKWRTVILKGRETNEESNKLSELIASREFSSHDTGRGDPGRAPRTSWVHLMLLRVQGDQRGKELTGQCTEEERAARRLSCRCLPRFPAYSADYWWTPSCTKATEGWERDRPRGLQAAVSRSHAEPRIVPLPTTQIRKPCHL